ncbi:MAG: hypothetical protein MUO41_09345 [Methyloceanibacter sp.]|jgi:hypothetical protein|nr:hypothetical protein [Methyloceanibacter sp.]
MLYVAIHLYVMAIGFTAAGLVASFVQLVSGEPLRFGIEPSSIISSLGGVLLRVLCGPVILMRNTWVDAKQRARSPVWLGLSVLVSGVWSLFSGALLLDLVLKL